MVVKLTSTHIEQYLGWHIEVFLLKCISHLSEGLQGVHFLSLLKAKPFLWLATLLHMAYTDIKSITPHHTINVTNLIVDKSLRVLKLIISCMGSCNISPLLLTWRPYLLSTHNYKYHP